MQPRLARITIYPIKSLDGSISPPPSSRPGRAWSHDRQFAIRDAEGKFVNGKRTPAVHPLAAQFDPAIETVTLGRRGGRGGDHVSSDARSSGTRSVAERLFGPARHARRRLPAGFPDDLDAPGPTLISTATLATVASWFPGMTVDDARLRFRTNLEIDGVEAFWEDRLYATAGNPVRFQRRPGRDRRHQSLPAVRRANPLADRRRRLVGLSKNICPASPGNPARLGRTVAIQPLLSPGREHASHRGAGPDLRRRPDHTPKHLLKEIAMSTGAVEHHLVSTTFELVRLPDRSAVGRGPRHHGPLAFGAGQRWRRGCKGFSAARSQCWSIFANRHAKRRSS